MLAGEAGAAAQAAAINITEVSAWGIWTFYLPRAVESVSGGYSNTAVGILVMLPHIAGLAAMILLSRSSDQD